MEIQVCSRRDARNFKCDVPWAVISITSSPHVWPDLSEENRVATLQLYFLDKTVPGENTFTEEQAHEVLKFVKGVKDQIECLLVHCDAGLSRSPAVAAAVARIFIGEGEDMPYFQRYWPNYLVYKQILEAHFGQVVTFQSEREEEPLDEPWDCCG